MKSKNLWLLRLIRTIVNSVSYDGEDVRSRNIAIRILNILREEGINEN